MKAALYCRLSEEDKNKAFPQADSESIQNQKNMLLQYAAEQQWEIYRIYSDDDYAGADRSRPAFRALLRDAEAKKFQIVLCKTQSRFTREMELVEKYLHDLFPKWGIRFVSIVDHADTENSGNKKARQINGLINEWYLEDMSENIRSVLTMKRRQGLHIGSFALYGYKKDPVNKGHLLIDPAAAQTITLIFQLYAAGRGKTYIARYLNQQQIPNPTQYKYLHGLRYTPPKQKNGALWSYSTVSSILSNEMYLGNMVQGKYGSCSYKTKQNRPRPAEQWIIVPHTHPPIINLALWQKVQQRLAQQEKSFSGGKVGIFSKLVYCAECGYAMRTTKNKSRTYLQCPCRRLSEKACIGSFLSVDGLEQCLLQEINCFCQQYLTEEVLAQLRSSHSSAKSITQEGLLLCQQEIRQISLALRQLYRDRLSGLLDEEEYLPLMEEYTQKRKLLRERQEQLSLLPADSESSPLPLSPPFSHLTREMTEGLLARINVCHRPQKYAPIPIEIIWKF